MVKTHTLLTNMIVLNVLTQMLVFLRKCVTNESRRVCIGTTSFVVSMSNVLNPTTFLRGKNERKPYVQCMNDDSILYITYI